MTLDSLPDLDTSGLCLVKTLPTALTSWPYRSTALRDGARTSTRTSSVAKGRTASIHCRPAPPRQTEALSSRTSRSRPLETSQPSGARHLAGGGLDNRRLLAGVVDKAFLAGAMDLAHRQAAALEPAPVDFAELGVAVAVRMLLEIFEMEQLERDAGLAPLGMQVGAVGNGPMMRGG